MAREFIMTPVFDRLWDSMDLTDDNLRELQSHLVKHLHAGNVM